jgi:hypothetical protein
MAETAQDRTAKCRQRKMGICGLIRVTSQTCMRHARVPHAEAATPTPMPTRTVTMPHPFISPIHGVGAMGHGPRSAVDDDTRRMRVCASRFCRQGSVKRAVPTATNIDLITIISTGDPYGRVGMMALRGPHLNDGLEARVQSQQRGETEKRGGAKRRGGDGWAATRLWA